MSIGFVDMTDEQREQVEELRGRLDSAYGTDAAHWVAAAEMILGGILDDLLATQRTLALAPLVDASTAETLALADVMARDVWNSHAGRTCDYDDLTSQAQQVQRDKARRHLDALRRFLA